MATGETYFRHSLRVNDYLCKGCTTCMRSCPTGAIRIRNGKAIISDNKCVDCGECMQVCPHKAIYIKQDDFGRLFNYRYRVCLVPTTFIGQFEEKYNTKAIYSCIQKLGFTHIYEVEHEMSRMVQLYNMYMDDHPEITTFISPYCPAVTRLIQVRFPSLVDNVIHVRAPLELASRVITKRLMDEGASRQSIGVFYVTPCAAKIAAVKYPVSGKETYVSGVINMDFLYNKVLLMLHDSDKNARRRTSCGPFPAAKRPVSRVRSTPWTGSRTSWTSWRGWKTTPWTRRDWWKCACATRVVWAACCPSTTGSWLASGWNTGRGCSSAWSAARSGRRPWTTRP